MAVPKNVQEAQKKLDAAAQEQKRRQASDNEPAATTPVEPQPAPEPVATPAPEPVDTTSASTSAPKKPEDAPASAAPGMDWETEYRKIEQQHRVLKGKYEAEVPIQHDEIKTLKRELDTLHQALEILTKEQAQAPEADKPAKQADTPAPATALDESMFAPLEITDDERMETGADAAWISLMEKVAKNAVAPMIRAALDSVMPAITAATQKAQRVEQTAAEQITQQYHARLDQLCPGWRNHIRKNSPEAVLFDKWLGETTETVSGMSYGEALNRHDNAADAERVANIFNLYFDTLKAPEPAPVIPVPAMAPIERPSLESLAEPARSASDASIGQQRQQKVYTAADITDLQRRKLTTGMSDSDYRQELSKIVAGIRTTQK